MLLIRIYAMEFSSGPTIRIKVKVEVDQLQALRTFVDLLSKPARKARSKSNANK